MIRSFLFIMKKLKL